jgi:uncharacterized protein YndB with AHSA1/START domain
MKILKVTGLVLVSIIILFVLAGLILPKEVNLEREIVIEAPVDSVFPMVVSFENFVTWSPWSEYDPHADIRFEGSDGQVGSVYHWSGNDDVGVGSMEIVDLMPNRQIDLKLVFTSPWESESDVYYKFEDAESATKVIWGYSANAPFPTNVVMKLVGMEKMLGKDYDNGLAKLKGMIEQG